MQLKGSSPQTYPVAAAVTVILFLSSKFLDRKPSAPHVFGKDKIRVIFYKMKVSWTRLSPKDLSIRLGDS